MEKENRVKKGIIAIIVILFIILVGIVIFMIQNNTQTYAYAKMVNKCTLKYKNYSLTLITNLYNEEGNRTSSTTEKIERKNNIKKMTYLREDGSVENTRWITKDKIFTEETKVIRDSNFISDDLDVLAQYISNNDKYEYLRNENYNNKECVVAKFSRQNGGKAIVWIDARRKVILKEERYNEKDMLQYEGIYDIELNCIQDNELKLPDTTDYTYIKD